MLESYRQVRLGKSRYFDMAVLLPYREREDGSMDYSFLEKIWNRYEMMFVPNIFPPPLLYRGGKFESLGNEEELVEESVLLATKTRKEERSKGGSSQKTVNEHITCVINLDGFFRKIEEVLKGMKPLGEYEREMQKDLLSFIEDANEANKYSNKEKYLREFFINARKIYFPEIIYEAVVRDPNQRYSHKPASLVFRHLIDKGIVEPQEFFDEYKGFYFYEHRVSENDLEALSKEKAMDTILQEVEKFMDRVVGGIGGKKKKIWGSLYREYRRGALLSDLTWPMDLMRYRPPYEGTFILFREDIDPLKDRNEAYNRVLILSLGRDEKENLYILPIPVILIKDIMSLTEKIHIGIRQMDSFVRNNQRIFEKMINQTSEVVKKCASKKNSKDSFYIPIPDSKKLKEDAGKLLVRTEFVISRKDNEGIEITYLTSLGKPGSQGKEGERLNGMVTIKAIPKDGTYWIEPEEAKEDIVASFLAGFPPINTSTPEARGVYGKYYAYNKFIKSLEETLGSEVVEGFRRRFREIALEHPLLSQIAGRFIYSLCVPYEDKEKSLSLSYGDVSTKEIEDMIRKIINGSSHPSPYIVKNFFPTLPSTLLCSNGYEGMLERTSLKILTTFMPNKYTFGESAVVILDIPYIQIKISEGEEWSLHLGSN